MDSLTGFAFIAIFAVFLTGSYGQVQVKVELSQDNAHIGDDLTINCKVSSSNTEDPTTWITWVKRINGDEVEIGTNNFINENFKETGRYSAEYDYEDTVEDGKADNSDLSKITFTLNIKDVKPEDSGDIGCKIPRQNVEVFKEFTVFGPIKSLQLTSRDVQGAHAMVHAEGQNVTFKEGEVRMFSCIVNGSFPKPNVKILIGNKDITNLFDRTDKLPPKETSKKGLRKLAYDTELRNNNLVISYEFSKKKFQCIAEVEGSGFDAISQSIGVDLSGFSPKFLCNQTFYVKMHQKNVQINCVVMADPPISDVKFYWSSDRPNDGGNFTLGPGENEGQYRAEIIEGESPNESIMALKIDRMFKQHYGKYYLEAKNKLGKSVHEIVLEKHPSSGGLTSDAHHLIASLVTMALALLVILV